jgi:RNA polymerase sigma-70 factor (ECF subfamily)
MEATVVDLFYQQDRQLRSKELPVTDEQLLLEYRQTGDRELFAQLVYRYERELYSYLRRFVGDRELAQDAFQGTFLQVHLKCDSFDPARRFKSWLYTIATNQAIDARRRQKRHLMVSLDSPAGNFDDQVTEMMGLLESSEPGPESRMDQAERVVAVQRTLELLPENLYTIIQLVYFQGMTYRDAAAVLEIPVGTVKSRLNLAVQKLAEAWMQSQVDDRET